MDDTLTLNSENLEQHFERSHGGEVERPRFAPANMESLAQTANTYVAPIDVDAARADALNAAEAAGYTYTTVSRAEFDAHNNRLVSQISRNIIAAREHYGTEA